VATHEFGPSADLAAVQWQCGYSARKLSAGAVKGLLGGKAPTGRFLLLCFAF
jgi:hypothetical protein